MQVSKFSSGVVTLQPDWDVPASVNVHCTTRVGGVSDAPFNSMNLGLHVNDNMEHVYENRHRCRAALQLPSEPLWLNQVHGIHVPFIDGFHNIDEVLTADGAFTRDCNTVLSVLTADCLPVVVSNADASAIAVMHAGWRGLAGGVLQSGLAHFDEQDELHAWLGPAIGPTTFEVGQDVFDAFTTRDASHTGAFDAVGDGKYLADIYNLARTELQRERKLSVTGGEHCTVSDDVNFHSFRRDGSASGRMATLAWIQGS